MTRLSNDTTVGCRPARWNVDIPGRRPNRRQCQYKRKCMDSHAFPTIRRAELFTHCCTRVFHIHAQESSLVTALLRCAWHVWNSDTFRRDAQCPDAHSGCTTRRPVEMEEYLHHPRRVLMIHRGDTT